MFLPTSPTPPSGMILSKVRRHQRILGGRRSAAGAVLCPAGGSRTQKTADLAGASAAPCTPEAGPRARRGLVGNQGFPHAPPPFKGCAIGADSVRYAGLLLFAAALIAAGASPSAGLRFLGTDGRRPTASRSPPRLAVAAAIVLGLARLPRETVCVGPVRLLQGCGRRKAPSGLSRSVHRWAAAMYIPAGNRVRDARPSDDLLGLAMLGVTFSVVKTLVVRLNAGAASFEPSCSPPAPRSPLGQPSRSPSRQTPGTPRWSSPCSC